MSKKIKFNKLRLTRANKGSQASGSISEFFDKSTEQSSKNDVINTESFTKIETLCSTNNQTSSPDQFKLKQLYDQTAKQIRKIKSPNKESENIITEFFKRNDENNDSICDFQESTKKRLAKPKLIVKPKRAKIKRNVGETSIKKFINQGNDELLFNKLLIHQSSIEKVDPEQLQLAMALSMSMEENQSLLNENTVENLPTTQERLGNIRNTLAQFGFKKNSNIDYDLPVFLGINKRHKFNKKCTDLVKRNDEKQKEKLLNRVQNLLKNQFNKQKCFKDNTTKFVLCSDFLKEHFCEDQKIFNINSCSNNSQSINKYYTGNLFTPSKIKAGHLLKNWNLIPGREKSPVKNTMVKNNVFPENDEYVISMNEETKNLKFDNCKKNQIEPRLLSPDLFADLDHSLNEHNISCEINDNMVFKSTTEDTYVIKVNSEEVLADVSNCENNEDIIKTFHEDHDQNESNNLDSIEISDEENIEQDDINNSQSSEILKEHSNLNDSNPIENHDISRMENILLSKYEKNLIELREKKSLIRDDCILVKQFEELHESLTSNVFTNTEKEYVPENQHLLHNDCYEKEKIINKESNCPTMQEKIEIKSVLKEIGFQTYSETEYDLPIFVGVFIPKKKNNEILDLKHSVNDTCNDIISVSKNLQTSINLHNKIVTKMTDNTLECIEISDDDCEVNNLCKQTDDKLEKLDLNESKNSNNMLENEYNSENCINREDTFSLSLIPLLKYYNLNSLKESDILYQKLISTNDDSVDNDDFNKTIEKLIMQTIENDNIDKLQLSLCKTLKEIPNETTVNQINNVVEELPTMQERMNIKFTLEQLGFKTYRNKQYNLPIFAGVFIPKTAEHNSAINSFNDSLLLDCDNVATNKDFNKFTSFLSSPTSNSFKDLYQEYPNTSVINNEESITPCEKMQVDSDDEIINNNNKSPKIEEHEKRAYDCIEISDDEIEVECNANANASLKRSFACERVFSNDSNETIKYNLSDIEYDYPTSQLNTANSYENITYSLPNQINTKNVTMDNEQSFSCCLTKSVSMNVIKNTNDLSDLYKKYNVNLNDTIDNLVNNVNNDSLVKKNLKPINELKSKSLPKTKSDSFLLNNKTFSKQKENSQSISSQTNRSRKLKRSLSILSFNTDNDNDDDDENYIIKKRNISPEPIYNEMTEIELNEELKKFGVKSLRRKNAINLLEYLYNTTHPFIETNIDSNEEDEDNYYDSEQYKDDSEHLESSQSSNVFDEFNPNVSFKAHSQADVEDELSAYILPSQPTKKIQTCLLPFHIAFKNFLTCNKNINENLLQYKPINIIKIRKFFKSIDLRYKLNDMKDFFDLHGITFEDKIEDKKSRKFCVIKL